jgi:hypothetical protein
MQRVSVLGFSFGCKNFGPMPSTRAWRRNTGAGFEE